MQEEQNETSELESKSRYINVFTDFAFKHLFGREVNKDLLIDFLNGILDGRKVIVDLEYGNMERKGPGIDYRKTIYDLYCTGDKGEQFIVEMQKSNPDNFKDRSIFYTSALIQEQGMGVKANWDYLLPEVFFIAIMNFKFKETNADHYLHDVRLLEINTKTVFYSKLNYIFIEMPKFKKNESDLKTAQDHWLFLLKNLYRFKKIPLSLSKKKEFIKFLAVAAIGNLNPEEMNAYQQSLKVQRDNFSVRQAAVKEGLVKGEQKGVKEAKREVAREMKKEGLSPAEIMKFTKLTAKEIEKL